MSSLGRLRDGLSLLGGREHPQAPRQPQKDRKKPPGAYSQCAAGSCRGKSPALPGAFPWERLGSPVLGGALHLFLWLLSPWHLLALKNTAKNGTLKKRGGNPLPHSYLLLQRLSYLWLLTWAFPFQGSVSVAWVLKRVEAHTLCISMWVMWQRSRRSH